MVIAARLAVTGGGGRAWSCCCALGGRAASVADGGPSFYPPVLRGYVYYETKNSMKIQGLSF